MLLAAIARPEKTAALVGISTAADHIVTSFNSLPLEVGALNISIYSPHDSITKFGIMQPFRDFI